MFFCKKYSIVKYIIVILLLFQFLTARAQRISPDDYIATYKDIAVREMLIYRIPASIKMAQALLESGIGSSPLATQANNHFGIKCHKGWEGDTFIQDDDEKNECFRKYLTAEESFKDHSLFLVSRPRYASLFELPLTDYKAWATGLKAAGYATNPNYAELLIRQIERYNLQFFDTITMMPTSLAGSLPPLAFTPVKASEKPEDRPTASPYGSSGSLKAPEEGITVGTGRQVYLHNRIKCIIAGKNESVERICEEMEIMPWQIYRYNDLDKETPIKEGEIIYLQPKRKKAPETAHLARQGESMRDISQLYGIKLKRLYKINGMLDGAQPAAGQRIRLR